MSTAETRLPTCYRHPDRDTGLSCAECGRPICTDCMTMSPVGPRCPDHAGDRRRIAAPPIIRRRSAGDVVVTKALIAINVGIYLVTALQGTGAGSLWEKTILWGPFVQHGDWWRLITAAFLHASILHIAFNMLALWWIGGPVEEYLGRTRYILLYLVSGLAGSAGALIVAPTQPVVGASGAIFGILGAMLIIEWQATGRLGGNALTLIVINLAIGFAYNGAGGNISIGGHIGGLVGGILTMLSFARWGRGHAAYGRIGPVGAAGIALVAVASVLVSYWRVGAI